MAHRPRPTFQKAARERAKREKRQLKLQKKLDRRAGTLPPPDGQPDADSGQDQDQSQ